MPKKTNSAFKPGPLPTKAWKIYAAELSAPKPTKHGGGRVPGAPDKGTRVPKPMGPPVVRGDK